MDIQEILGICGSISIIGAAVAVIYKAINPALKFAKRVEELEIKNDEERTKLESMEKMQKQQSKCLAAMLNHMITGNGIENMKEIRDELLTSIIEN